VKRTLSLFHVRDPKRLFIAYLEDIFFSLAVPQEHDQCLRALCTKLQTYGILLKPAKWVLLVSVISFLGYKSTYLGSKPLPERVGDLPACPPTKTDR